MTSNSNISGNPARGKPRPDGAKLRGSGLMYSRIGRLIYFGAMASGMGFFFVFLFFAQDISLYPAYLMWVVVLFSSVAIFIGHYNLFGMSLTKLKNFNRSVNQVVEEDVDSFIKNFLRPLVHHDLGVDNVSNRASDLISSVNKGSNDEIVFFGAASLQTGGSSYGAKMAGTTTDPSDEQTPYYKYVAAIETATSNRIRVWRYVHLWDTGEFNKRSLELKHSYVRWLERQADQIKRNENYKLVHSPRAPAWGASIARIVLNQAVMLISGNGEASITIIDSRPAERTKQGMRDAVLAGKKSNIRFYVHNVADHAIQDDGYIYVSHEELREHAEQLKLSIAAETSRH